MTHKKEAKHQTGTYGIPAGRLDSGETAEVALLREFNQETGLSTNMESIQKLPFKYSAVIQRKNEAPRMFSLDVWYCHRYEGEIKEMQENIPEWVKVSQLNKYNLLPNMQKIVTDAIEYLS